MSSLPATAIPGPRANRFVQSAGFLYRPVPYFEHLRATYGDVFRVRVADAKPWVVLSAPNHIKQVFTGSPSVFHAGQTRAVLSPLLGDSSTLLVDDAPHLRKRKLLLPAFHGERMLAYGDLIRKAAEEEIKAWPIDQPFPVAPGMLNVTLAAIMRAVFGLADTSDVERLGTLLMTVLHEFQRPRTLLKVAALGPDRYRRLSSTRRLLAPADTALYAEIARRRSASDLQDRDDILSLLMQARDEGGHPIDDQELRDELITLLVAGHETTATSLSWAIERLVRHPDKLQRLQTELDEGREEYLDGVIKETLRLRPVLAVVLRDLQASAEVAGYNLPAGTRIACSITLAHRRPETYPNPHAFMPERFLDEAPGTYSWIPFGGGVRRCLGASFAMFEMKQVLTAVVRTLELRPLTPASERLGRRFITLAPRDQATVIATGQRRTVDLQLTDATPRSPAPGGN